MKFKTVAIRCFQIILLSAIAGAVWGVSWGLVGTELEGAGDWRSISAAIGAVGGLLISPLFLVTLMWRPLGKSFALITIPTAVALHIGVTFDIGLFVVLALCLPVLMALIARIRFPDTRSSPNPSVCSSCGYNLTGNTSGKCPECGAACRS